MPDKSDMNLVGHQKIFSLAIPSVIAIYPLYDLYYIIIKLYHNKTLCVSLILAYFLHYLIITLDFHPSVL